MDSIRKLEMAKWVMERNLGWIASADIKIGVLVTVNIAMIGALGAVAVATDSFGMVHMVASAIGFVALLASTLCCAICLLPRTTGPADSMIFFGRIADKEESEFVERLIGLTDESAIADLGAQIHCNATIAKRKHHWVGWSMAWTLGALLPWSLAVGLFAFR